MNLFNPKRFTDKLFRNMPGLMNNQYPGVNPNWLVFANYAICLEKCQTPDFSFRRTKAWTDVCGLVLPKAKESQPPITWHALPAFYAQIDYVIFHDAVSWQIFKRDDHGYVLEKLIDGNNLSHFWHSFMNYHRDDIKDSDIINTAILNATYLSDALFFAFIFLVYGFHESAIELMMCMHDVDHHLLPGIGVVDIRSYDLIPDGPKVHLETALLGFGHLICGKHGFRPSHFERGSFLANLWNYGSASDEMVAEMIMAIRDWYGLDADGFWNEFFRAYGLGAKLPSVG